MYRDFGISMAFLDRPIPVARTLAYAEIKEAVETYEPRATVLGINFEEQSNAPGLLIPTVEVSINVQ